MRYRVPKNSCLGILLVHGVARIASSVWRDYRESELNQYTEDPLLDVYHPKPRKFGRRVNGRDRLFGVAVIIGLIFGFWWLVFHDSTSYVFTAEQVESVFKPDSTEVASGYTEYSLSGKAPQAIIMRTGASDDELSGAIKRIEHQMSIATEELAREYPNEFIHGSKFDFHNLIIFCSFAQNCQTYERRFLNKVQSLGLLDATDRNFVPDSRIR